ncbi:MAG: YceI family protein [Solirubrobacteraceae bacterium]
MAAESTPELGAAGWYLDPEHSVFEFQVPFYWGFGTVRGRFAEYTGVLDLRDRPAIELTIDADGLATGSAARDRRLKDERFFDVEHHPYVRFVSHTARLTGEALAVRGELSARGRRVALELEARVEQADGGYELRAETFVMHSGLGMTWNPLGITRPYSKLIVAGRLCAELGDPSDAGRPVVSRRPSRRRCGTITGVHACRRAR